ncbi:MAG TPA: hypothetical protein VEK08_12875 [Planctomycetota bacterium]|nr:hypothetical protein [Planctomycetota bacterium]
MAITGEVVFQRVFNLRGTIEMKKARTLLADMIDAGTVHTKHAAPEYVSFAAPVALNLSALKLDLKLEDDTPVAVSARLYEVGALALMLRIPARGEKLSELGRFTSAQLYCRGKLVRRSQVFALILEEVSPRLETAFDEIFDVPVDPESYTTYCLTEVPGGAEYALHNERAQVAGLLIGEQSFDRLSSMEIDDTLKNWSNYYQDDLVIADWDAGFIIEPNGQYEDILYIFEVANLQLLALRKYDQYLDMTLEKGYEDYERLSKGPMISTARAREMVRDLSEVRMDLAKVTDEIANTAKFFGDWYIARVYMGLAEKLHISDYHKTVEEKLATLNDLYQSVLSEINGRQMLILEAMIVLLIVFEVVMAFFRH